ncbi:response regulator [Ectothiorhodospira shaposhnikovii]|uniref:response regulator n=1 Tax=Ectothiorhodospira shaposhnikovii TaxID=1054 RepID=UPI001EE982E0|nr:response regulator [Ectothiorhodospira shaposhnikovii]MCG5512766.1 response regulator [Ectothiorhodospira shaposhnikovii]
MTIANEFHGGGLRYRDEISGGDSAGTGNGCSALRVLIVEDEQGISQELISDLERRGVESVPVESSEQALLLLHDGFRPDCILIDLMMPEGDGFWLVDHVRRFYTHHGWLIPALVVMTGSVEQAFIRGIFRKKVDDFLLKPADMAGFRDVVLRGCALTRLRMQLLRQGIPGCQPSISAQEARSILQSLVPEENLEEVIQALYREGVLPPVTL